MRELGERSKERRLSLNLTRNGLGSRSGVSVSVIRQFELSGKISLESFIKAESHRKNSAHLIG